MAARVTIAMVNLGVTKAVLTDGSVVPIVSLLDKDGQPTAEVEACETFICGAGDRWFQARLDAFKHWHQKRKVH